MPRVTFVVKPETIYKQTVISPIQGITRIFIHNYTPDVLTIDNISILPHEKFLYRGKYGIGIPIGDILQTNIGEILITHQITDIIFY